MHLIFEKKYYTTIKQPVSKRPAYLDKDLNCFWLHHGNPYMKLGPYKFELKNKEPEIAYVHDMVSKAEMERIKAGKINAGEID